MPPRVHDASLGLHISGSRMRGFADREAGCKRKWALEYIGGIVPPPSKGQRIGTALHWIGENYLRDGVPPSMCPLPPAANDDVEAQKAGYDSPAEVKACHEKAKPIFAAGVTYLPAPKRPTLLVEHPAEAKLDNGGTFTGTMDFLDLGGAVPEVGDHKSTKQLRYVKSVEQLRRDPQTLGYGFLAGRKVDSERVRFRWNYYRTTGAPMAVPVKFELDREYLEKAWRRINEVGSEMLDLWNSKVDPLKVTPNESACSAFGGCYFKSICHKGGRPMGAGEGSSIFQQLKSKANQGLSAAPAGGSGGPPSKAPPQDDAEDIFAGADSVQVNPPLSPAAKAFADAAKAQKNAGPAEVRNPNQGYGASTTQKPIIMTGAETSPPLSPAAEAFVAAAKKPRKAKGTLQDKAAEARAAGVTLEQVQAAADKLEREWAPEVDAATLAVLAVFVDCIPLKGYGTPRNAFDVFAPAMRRAAELQGVANWRLIDFGKGDGVLAACVSDQLEADRTTGVVLVDSGTKEGRALMGVLEQYADVFVRAMR